MLQIGSKGQAVSQLQAKLNSSIMWASYDTKLVVDGVFGNATFNAVKLYQAQNGLPISGIADTNTLKKLGLTSFGVTSSPSSSVSVSTKSFMEPIYNALGGKTNTMIAGGIIMSAIVLGIMSRPKV